MTRRCASVAAIALLGALCSGHGIAQPPVQIPFTQQRIATAQRMPAPCLSLALEQASIGLPANELERAAQVRRASASAPEDEAQRLAWIAGGRAQALLASAGERHDRRGCAVVESAQADTDSLYLVGQLLERGQAVVWTNAPPGVAAAIEVKHINPHCQHGPMGSASYRVADGGPLLLMLVECVT
ncbi:hypothetical protein [Xanthomonas bonasiae]|uniref:hypothetical protein n=1 Tax=Xanthomonas bonasiae TaxID=2810351 RepID=UPI00177B04B8|nr:hypothetical protein [Xanthomonas surreyensis]MBD7920340.1 hypothetical protein [Xanthomonas surreyensis]